MIKEVEFLAFKKELTEATIVFEIVADSYVFHFNGYNNFQDYRTHLTHLHYKFCKETSDNISVLKTNNEIDIHLEMHVCLFELLKDQVDERSDVDNFLRNTKIITKGSTAVPFISHKPSDLAELMRFLKFQKRIIKVIIKQLKSSQNKYALSNKPTDLIRKSWRDNFQEFCPVSMKIRGELHAIKSISDKISHIQKTREHLVADDLAKGIDFYDSPLNLYFESCIECLKSLSNTNKEADEKSVSSLKWTASKSDFIELVLSLKLSKAIESKDGSQLSRKKLFRQFESFLNIEPIQDVGSRIHKLKYRSNSSPFLDRLKEYCNRFFNNED